MSTPHLELDRRGFASSRSGADGIPRRTLDARSTAFDAARTGRARGLRAGGPVWLVALAFALSAPAGAAGPDDTRARVEAALQANDWSLQSAADGTGRRVDALFPAPDRGFEFRFAGARLSIHGGCNPLAGAYALDPDGRLRVGRLASGMRACEAPLMRADEALAALLARPLAIEVTEGPSPRARLTSPPGTTLVLLGRPTPEARYGAGAVVFLEVAARRIPCTNPLTSETTCLQFRERRFDEKGIAVGVPGPWRPLYATIEGYAHQDGVRNVLRVKRFDRGGARADAATSTYVLDLVVESEVLAK